MPSLSYRQILTAWATLSLLLCIPQPAQAASVQLIPVADTTLIETAPTNNLGGQTFFNAGTTRLNPGTKNRGLLKFDIAGSIPAGSIITSARLELEVVRSPATGAAGSFFGVYRMLRDWGEGNKNPGFNLPGLGLAATEGEATWTHRFFPTEEWSVPGGEPDVDFFEFGSTDSPFVEFDDRYRFPSTLDTVTDVQGWLDHPESNFGYVLRSSREGTQGSARRFGSREDRFDAPLLIVEFIPFQITQASIENNEMVIQFPAVAGQAYDVEARTNPAIGSWTSITNIAPLPADATVTVRTPADGDQRYFRLVQP